MPVQKEVVGYSFSGNHSLHVLLHAQHNFPANEGAIQDGEAMADNTFFVLLVFRLREHFPLDEESAHGESP